jgi:hypothetical protein
VPQLRSCVVASAALVLSMLVLPAQAADGVEDSIQLGLRAYQQGESTKAANHLRYAAGLIGDAGVKKTADLLPAAPKGWSAAEGEREQVNFMGGFLSLVREYRKGDVTLVVRTTADSPMFYDFVNTLAAEKTKLKTPSIVTVNGRPAALKEEGKVQASLAVPLKNGVLVTVSGNANRKQITEFVESLDLSGIEKL